MEKTNGVTLFSEAKNEMAFLKMGILGYAGHSGDYCRYAQVVKDSGEVVNAM